MTRMKAGDEIYIKDHSSVPDGLNAYVLDDSGEEIWFVTAHGNNSTIVPDGSRHVLPREFIQKGKAQ